MKVYRIGLVMGVLYGGCSTPALSQQGATEESEEDVGWAFKLSTGFEVEPAYTGSDTNIGEPDFNAEASYYANSGHRYFLSLGEVGVVWRLGENTELSTILEYEFGRDNSADTALSNFPKVEDTVEAQAVLQRRIGHFIVGAGIQQDIQNRGKGLVGFFGAAFQTELTDRLSIQTVLDASFADAEHMQTEVGISPVTAAITGYDSYTAPAGYKGMTAQLNLEYEFSKQWLAMTSFGFENYGSNMSDSPLIEKAGTDTTYEASVGVQYNF